MGAPAEAFGPYTVYEQIGLGGMATVHRAEAQGIAGFSKQVALKRMLPSVAQDAGLVKSFIREARLASHLRHANVAQTYDLGKVGEIYFIAMELVPGRNLRELLKHCASVVGHMPMPVAMNIVNQIADALDYAHNLCDDSGQPLGIIHRDVSPSNIIVSEGGVVKLIDFGIAKASGRGMNTQSGTIKGKFGYMAPEYLMGSIDARADLFALGVIAHELLSNRPLFQGKDDMDTLYKVKDMAVMPPSHFNKQVPRELDAIIMTALERDPEQRWQRANALHTALSTETKRLGLVAPNSQVFEWIEWAFQQHKGQFDEESEPMISISGGTTELPRGTPAQRRELPDDFSAASDSLQTLIKPASSRPFDEHDMEWKAPKESPALKRPDDWNVATDMTVPMSESMDRQWGKSSTAEPTKMLRPSGNLRAPSVNPELLDTKRDREAPDPELIDTRRNRSSSEVMGRARGMAATDEDQIKTLPPPPSVVDEDQIRTMVPPGRVANQPRPDQARTVMMAPSPSDPPAHQAKTVMLDVNNQPAPFASTTPVPYRAPDAFASTTPAPYRSDRPSQPPPPLGVKRPSQPPPVGANPAFVAANPPFIPGRNTPQPQQVNRTLPGQGGMSTPNPGAAAAGPMSPILSGMRTTPHIPRQRDTPPGLDNLDARGERPAARQLVPAPTVAKTRVEPRRSGASNFLLAVLVLIAAGGAAAVVYFALPYLT